MYNESFRTVPTISKSTVLVVEDSEEDYEMLLRVIKKRSIRCDIFHCETGREALDFLWNQGKYEDRTKFKKPSMILLDLNLPGIDGRVVLERIKSDETLRFIPVVIFSTSSNPKDINVCYDKGTNAYVIKPMDILKLQDCIELLLKHWLEINTVSFEKLLA